MESIRQEPLMIEHKPYQPPVWVTYEDAWSLVYLTHYLDHLERNPTVIKLDYKM
jgi:hypothetical protein